MNCARCKRELESWESSFKIYFLNPSNREGEVFCVDCARIMALRKGIIVEEEEDLRKEIEFANMLTLPKKPRVKKEYRELLDFMRSTNDDEHFI